MFDKLDVMVKSAYLKTRQIVTLSKAPTAADFNSLFQYIVMHWLVVMEYPRDSLRNFTVSDYINKKELSVTVRKVLRDAKAGVFVLRFSTWFHTVLDFYFSTVGFYNISCFF